MVGDMKKHFFFLFLISSWASAEENFKVYVNTFDSDLDTSSIESPQVDVTKGAGPYKSRVAELPSPEEMQIIFNRADLELEVKEMNQMDRDILFRKVAERDLASVQKSYPQFRSQKLENLKKSIGDSK
jgi:hypothetical protein